MRIGVIAKNLLVFVAYSFLILKYIFKLIKIYKYFKKLKITSMVISLPKLIHLNINLRRKASYTISV
jgi:hypothetical protein